MSSHRVEEKLVSRQDTPLQNIPIRTELGRQIRREFARRVDHVFMDVDYEAIEMRIYVQYRTEIDKQERTR